MYILRGTDRVTGSLSLSCIGIIVRDGEYIYVSDGDFETSCVQRAIAERYLRVTSSPTDDYYTKEEVDALITEADMSLETRSPSEDYAATEDDEVLLCDASGSQMTISIPAADAVPGKFYYIKKIDSSNNAIIIDPDGTETLDDQETISIAVQYECLKIVSDGTEWWII